MDLVTHTLAGVGVGHAALRRRYGPEAVTVLAWASILPNIDSTLLLTGAPAAILFRRTFGHSLLLMPLWVLALAVFFKWRYRERSLGGFLGLCGLGVAVHLALDLLDSYGTFLLWPVSSFRPALDVLFGIDVFLLAILLAPFMLAVAPSLRPRLQTLCRISLACAAAYVLFAWSQHGRAATILSKQTETYRPSFSRVLPEPLGPLRWRGIARSLSEYERYDIRSLAGRTGEPDIIATQEDAPAALLARSTEMGKRLDAFYMAPIWRVQVGPDGSALASVYDLKSISLAWGPKKLIPFRFFVAGNGAIEPLGWLGRPGMRRGPKAEKAKP
ncbi:MAG: metal-dependent hydrolase [Elusimicrobia bacterium]|nr:metal-dependent hydrolase [Elusimicrobiota bacterium]